MTSSSTRSGRDSRNAPTASEPSATCVDLEPLVAQHDAEHLGEREVVVDDQYPTLHDILLPGSRRPRAPLILTKSSHTPDRLPTHAQAEGGRLGQNGRARAGIRDGRDGDLSPA